VFKKSFLKCEKLSISAEQAEMEWGVSSANAHLSIRLFEFWNMLSDGAKRARMLVHCREYWKTIDMLFRAYFEFAASLRAISVGTRIGMRCSFN
jgi:hypothetical protein